MQKRTTKIKEIAKKLLDEKKIDFVLGHKKGSIPMKNAPFFAQTPEDVDLLIWDGNCRSNLANFLTHFKDKRIAIVAQGCVSRNIVGLILEKQINRDNIYVIGVPCIGMLSRDKLKQSAKGEIVEVKEDNDQVIIKGVGGETTVSRKDLIRDNCNICTHRNPVLSDELVAESVKEQEVADQYEEVKKIESMTAEDKSKFFEELYSTCIRCYACRDACPLCYCPECFVDKFNPQWCGKSQDSQDVLSYHIIRAFHVAGRCTECGACEDACPMGIKVRILTSKAEKDIRENYDAHEPWESLESQPPLVTFKIDDPQPFIK